MPQKRGVGRQYEDSMTHYFAKKIDYTYFEANAPRTNSLGWVPYNTLVLRVLFYASPLEKFVPENSANTDFSIGWRNNPAALDESAGLLNESSTASDGCLSSELVACGDDENFANASGH